MPSPDELLARVARDGNNAAAGDLLREFFHGYPVQNLRCLLRSEAEDVVKAGAWIASELADRACPIKQDIFELMDHPSRYVRFFVLDVVLICADPSDGPVIAGAIRKLLDPDEAVRWKALGFISKATLGQLIAGADRQADEEIGRLTSWLVNVHSRADRGVQILDMIQANDSNHRQFGVAAAARLSSEEKVALQHAAESSDPEISSFALEHLRSLH